MRLFFYWCCSLRWHQFLLWPMDYSRLLPLNLCLHQSVIIYIMNATESTDVLLYWVASADPLDEKWIFPHSPKTLQSRYNSVCWWKNTSGNISCCCRTLWFITGQQDCICTARSQPLLKLSAGNHQLEITPGSRYTSTLVGLRTHRRPILLTSEVF